jgi:hypothetical protein
MLISHLSAVSIYRLLGGEITATLSRTRRNSIKMEDKVGALHDALREWQRKQKVRQ